MTMDSQRFSILDIMAPATDVLGPTDVACRACGNATGNRVLSVPGDPLTYPSTAETRFSYVQCGGCGSLSLIDIPTDLGRYYEGTYYSHTERRAAGWRAVLQGWRDQGHLYGAPLPARFLADLKPYVRLTQLRRLIEGRIGAKLTPNSPVLDVGCGSGDWLCRLARLGFTDLTGADPFLHEEMEAPPVRLIRADVEDLTGRYALISCNHALEHAADPAASLAAMRDRLAEGGVILLRVPVLNHFAWSAYGGHWVQLDAPRHLVLFSVEGVRRLAQTLGLRIAETEFDANEFMLLGSEARKRGAFPHGPPDVWARELSAPGVQEVRMARRRAVAANADGTSDQASFFLTRDG